MIAFPPPPLADSPVDEKTGSWRDSWAKWFGIVAREFQTDDEEPDVPAGLALVTGLENVAQTVTAYITASWTASTAEDHDFYVVKLIRGSETVGVESSATTNSYKFAPLVPGVSYSVQVKDVDDSGNASEYCTAVTVASAGDTTAPATPSGLAAAAVGVKQIRVTWTANTEADLAGYELHASTTTGFTPSDSTKIAFVSDATAYTYDTPTYALYYFKIRSKDTSQNYSGYATQVSATSVQVVTADITDANVTTAKIATANITTALIADANITTAKIADANITTAKIASAAITEALIGTAAITNAKIGNLAVDTLQLSDNAVTSLKRSLVSTSSQAYGPIASATNGQFTVTHNLGRKTLGDSTSGHADMAVWLLSNTDNSATFGVYNFNASSLSPTAVLHYL